IVGTLASRGQRAIAKLSGTSTTCRFGSANRCSVLLIDDLDTLPSLLGCKQRFKTRRKSQLPSVLLPQGVSRRLRQIVKIDPHVASRRTGKIFPPDLLVFLRQLGPDTVWIERQRICPLDLCSFWIDLKTSFLADREPSLPLLICHDRSHLLSPFCSWFRLLPLMRTLAMPCADVTGAPFWRICRAA